MPHHETAPDVLPVPFLLEASRSGNTLDIVYGLGLQLPDGTPHTERDRFALKQLSAVLTGEAPTPYAVLVLFLARSEVARFRLGRPLAEIVPGLLTAFPDLPRVHPALLAAHLREQGQTLIYPIPGLPECPSLFPSELKAAEFLRDHNAISSAADKIFSGEGGEALTGEEADAGAALLEQVRDMLEQEAEPEPAQLPPHLKN